MKFLLITFALLLGQEDVVIERKQYREKIQMGESITVINRTGDVRVRRGAPDVAEVYAVVQNLQKQTPAPEMKIERSEKKLIFKMETTNENQAKPDRADLVVYVPDNSAVEIETLNGLIEVKGIHGATSVQSDKGEIVVRSAEGDVQALNGSGSILVELLPGVTDKRQSFTSRTGDISIYVQDKMDAKFELETSGEISTDFSIQIEYEASKEPDKAATAILGSGEKIVKATSKRGRIRLLRLLKTLPRAEVKNSPKPNLN